MSSRFDLDKSIAMWRRRYEHDRAFLPEDLRELERHVRDYVAAQTERGRGEEEAFLAVMREMGEDEEVREAYRTVRWGKLKRKQTRARHLAAEAAMLKSYFKTSLRNVLRHKGYATINVAGLSIGAACCLLVFLFIRNELAVNGNYPDADRLFRIESEWREASAGLPITAPAAAGQALKQAYPEVEEAARFYLISGVVKVGEKSFRREVAMTDPSVLEMFGLPLLHGDPRTALMEPQTMVITERLALALFGTTDVMGRTAVLETWNAGDQAYTITGVIGKMPFDTLFNGFGPEQQVQDVIIPPLPYGHFLGEPGWTSWFSPYILHYVKLKPGADAEAVNRKVAAFIETHAPDELHGEVKIRLSPFRTEYLTSADGRGWKVVYLLGSIAALILLVACVNFMNLSTARSFSRVKEVGVRKTVGASRGQLVYQFLGESLLMSGAAILLGALGAFLALRPFFALLNKPLVLPQPWDGVTLLAMGALLVATCLLAGGYPAFVLSSFNPVKALKGLLRFSPSTVRLRQGLVVAQFGAAMVLLVGVLTVSRQISYLLNQDLGFSEQVLVIRSLPRQFDDEGVRRMEALKEHLLKVPGVTAAAVSWDVPGGERNFNGTFVRRADGGADDSVNVPTFTVDAGFTRTYDLEMVEGRFFEPGRAADDSTVVVNESAARALGWSKGEDMAIRVPGRSEPVPVIGVMKDFHFESLRSPIRPAVFFPVGGSNSYRLMSLRLATSDLAGMVRQVQQVWNEVLPGAPFETFFMDDYVEGAYQTELQVRQIVSISAALAIFIAALGLLGLASLTAAQRTKEIGVRKVLGASVGSIVGLLSKDFLKLVVVAFLLAAPLSYYLMSRWLEAFAYRIELGPGVFLGAGALALLTAFGTVSYQAVKAALADPVKSLRYE